MIVVWVVVLVPPLASGTVVCCVISTPARAWGVTNAANSVAATRIAFDPSSRMVTISFSPSRVAVVACLRLIVQLERERPVRRGSAGAQRRRQEGRLDDLLARGARLLGAL